MSSPKVTFQDGCIVVGEGASAVKISGTSLTVKSLVNRLIGHYPDTYPWVGPDLGDKDSLDYPPNSLPISRLPEAIRSIRQEASKRFEEIERELNALKEALK